MSTDYGLLSDKLDTILTMLPAPQADVERAAEAIAALDVGRWAGWVIYGLEALQGREDGGRYEAMLQVVAASIGERLAEGQW